MRKLSILIVISLMIFSSCGNQAGKKAKKETTKEVSIEEQYITADLKIKMDSLASSLSKLQFIALGKDKDGKLVLTEKEKKVKPDYLLPLSKAKDLLTLSQKWSALAVYDIDIQVAKIYDMPIEEYKQVLAKLALEVNSPAVSANIKNYDFGAYFNAIYKENLENGTLDIYWGAIASGIIESLYIFTQNIDKFMLSFTDETASEMTYRIILVHEAITSLIPFHPEMADLNKVLEPLSKINATSVKELSNQLIELKEEITAARNSIF